MFHMLNQYVLTHHYMYSVMGAAAVHILDAP